LSFCGILPFRFVVARKLVNSQLFLQRYTKWVNLTPNRMLAGTFMIAVTYLFSREPLPPIWIPIFSFYGMIYLGGRIAEWYRPGTKLFSNAQLERTNLVSLIMTCVAVVLLYPNVIMALQCGLIGLGFSQLILGLLEAYLRSQNLIKPVVGLSFIFLINSEVDLQCAVCFMVVFAKRFPGVEKPVVAVTEQALTKAGASVVHTAAESSAAKVGASAVQTVVENPVYRAVKETVSDLAEPVIKPLKRSCSDCWCSRNGKNCL